MKLNKIFFIAILFFSSVLFANNEPKLWAHGDIINPIELSSLLDRSQITIPAPDFLLEPNWTEFDFGAGDTTQTYSLNHASIIYFVYVDSSKNTSSQGVDTLWIGITNTLSNGMIIDAPIKVQNMNQATSTTFLSGALLIPGNDTKTIYAITPAVYNQTKITGTLKIARLNKNDNITPYVDKGRGLLAQE